MDVRGEHHSPTALLREKKTLVHIAWEAKWGSEPVLTLRENEKSLGPYRDSNP